MKDRQNEHKLKETDQKDLALTVNNLFTYNEMSCIKQELAAVQCNGYNEDDRTGECTAGL